MQNNKKNEVVSREEFDKLKEVFKEVTELITNKVDNLGKAIKLSANRIVEVDTRFQKASAMIGEKIDQLDEEITEIKTERK